MKNASKNMALWVIPDNHTAPMMSQIESRHHFANNIANKPFQVRKLSTLDKVDPPAAGEDVCTAAR